MKPADKNSTTVVILRQDDLMKEFNYLCRLDEDPTE